MRDETKVRIWMIIGMFLLNLTGVGCATNNRFAKEPTLEQYEQRMPGFNSAPAHSLEADGTMNVYDRFSHVCATVPMYNWAGGIDGYKTYCD